MQLLVYQPSVLIAVAWLLTALSGVSLARDDDAERLVSAMKVDQSALLGMQISAKHSFQKGKTSRKMLDCVLARTKQDFTPLFATIYRAHLSPAEIRDAIAYMESPSGKKYTTVGIAQLYRRLNETPPEPPPTLTPEDESALVLFSVTPTGKKLFALKVAEMPDTKHAIQMKVLEVIETCQQE